MTRRGIDELSFFQIIIIFISVENFFFLNLKYVIVG